MDISEKDIEAAIKRSNRDQKALANRVKAKQEIWDTTYFERFYNDNETGGSSRWLVSPDTVKVFIDGLLFSKKQQFLAVLDKFRRKHDGLGEDVEDVLDEIIHIIKSTQN